jgi:ABC-2 type transport system permease protein
MKSKTSFINKGILHNDFKRYTWIGIVYLLALLFSVPLRIFMLYSRPEEITAHYNAFTYLRVLQLDYSPITLLLFLVVPVLTGLLLFRYLQTGKAADMEHALPIKRETLYNTHILTGLSFLLVPVIITALVSWALVTGLGIDFIQGKDILAWLKISLLINLLLFMSTVAIGMFTGLSSMQGILTYILLLVPAGLSMLILDNFRMYVYGFALEYYQANIDTLSPLLNLFGFSSIRPIPTGKFIMYLLICVALYFIGRYLYQRRKVEAAGDAITFAVLRPIFKYSVTFCTMLLLGSYFHSSQDSMAWTYFGYFLGAGLGYFLIEILLNKSIYVFNWQRIKGLGVYTLVIIGLIGLLHADFTGYEKRLPELSQIENVYMDSYFHPLIYGDSINTRTTDNRPHQAIFTEKNNIAYIHALHQEIIANRGEEKGIATANSNIRKERVCLAYQLRNGKRICRNYNIPVSKYTQQLKPIYESREFKMHHNEVLRLDLATIKLIEINSRDGNKNMQITDPKLIQQAITVLQSDIYAESYEEMMFDQRPAWADITITVPRNNAPDTSTHDVTIEDNYQGIHISWQKSYINFEHWLQSTGLYEQSRLFPGEISFAIIDSAPDGNDNKNYRNNLIEASKLEEKPGTLKITDADKLEICLRNYEDYYTKEAAYPIFFKLKNGSTLSGIFLADTAPDFVKQHFNR